MKIEFCTTAEWICQRVTMDGTDPEVADCYIDAAIDALSKDPRANGLDPERATGQRMLYHGWNGANTHDYQAGIFLAFEDDDGELTDAQKAALDDADTFGRREAQKLADHLSHR